MARMSSNLSAAVARQHGIVSDSQLMGDGLERNARRRLVTAGLLICIHRGVYRVATAADTFESRCVAACLVAPDAVITGPAAARLWDFRHVYRPERPVVMVAHDRTPFAGGVLVRRSNRIDDSHVVERIDGIRVASPPRTWFDCARDLDDHRFESLTEWVLDRHSSVPTLWRLTRELAMRGRPGSARVHRVMSQRSDWQRPAGSGLELRVLKALDRRKIAPLVRQYPLRLSNGVLIHPDGADPTSKWAVEIDHVTWHGGRTDAQADKGRDRNARRIGWQVDRVTDLELANDFAGAINELVELWLLRREQAAAA